METSSRLQLDTKTMMRRLNRKTLQRCRMNATREVMYIGASCAGVHLKFTRMMTLSTTGYGVLAGVWD